MVIRNHNYDPEDLRYAAALIAAIEEEDDAASISSERQRKKLAATLRQLAQDLAAIEAEENKNWE